MFAQSLHPPPLVPSAPEWLGLHTLSGRPLPRPSFLTRRGGRQPPRPPGTGPSRSLPGPVLCSEGQDRQAM